VKASRTFRDRQQSSKELSLSKLPFRSVGRASMTLARSFATYTQHSTHRCVREVGYNLWPACCSSDWSSAHAIREDFQTLHRRAQSQRASRSREAAFTTAHPRPHLFRPRRAAVAAATARRSPPGSQFPARGRTGWDRHPAVPVSARRRMSPSAYLHAAPLQNEDDSDDKSVKPATQGHACQ
jgi:hypothetical protein